MERPGLLLMVAFVAAQLVWVFTSNALQSMPVSCTHMCIMLSLTHAYGILILCFWFLLQAATFIAVYANWGFAEIRGIGWGWAGVIWLYSLVTYMLLDPIKFAIRYILSGRAWDLLLERKVISCGLFCLLYLLSPPPLSLFPFCALFLKTFVGV